MTSTSTCPYCRLIQLAAHEIVLCRGCGQLFNPNPPPGEKLLPLENLKERLGLEFVPPHRRERSYLEHREGR